MRASEAAELIDWYRARWEIEMYFDVLKNGCQVESLQLRTLPRLEMALALFMIVAWRINRLMRLGRNLPDVDASLLFEEDEIVAAHILNKNSVPENPPTLNQMVRLVAMAGGFLGRKSDGEPGAKTIWQGMERVLSFAEGMRYVRTQLETSCVPSSPARTCADFEAQLIQMDGEDDHVHLSVEYPSKVAVSHLVNSLKGVSSRLLRKERPDIQKRYWKGVLWSPSYFASSCGGAPISIVRQYIEQQQTPH